MALTADSILSNINVIRNSLIVPRINVSVASTATAQPNTSIPSTLTDQNSLPLSVYLGSAPLLLHSLSFAYGSTFQAKFSLYTKLAGLNIDNQQWGIPPSATSGFDYVPVGKEYLIPPNSTLDIFAYNSGGSATAGVFSVLAVFQKVDTISQEDIALLA